MKCLNNHKLCCSHGLARPVISTHCSATECPDFKEKLLCENYFVYRLHHNMGL